MVCIVSQHLLFKSDLQSKGEFFTLRSLANAKMSMLYMTTYVRPENASTLPTKRTKRYLTSLTLAYSFGRTHKCK